MAKKKLMNPSHVLVFVEGDTDEVFFKTLIDYYTSVSSNKLLPYDVCYKIKTVCYSYDTDVFEVKQPQIVKWDAIAKSVKRMGIDEFICVGVKSSIED